MSKKIRFLRIAYILLVIMQVVLAVLFRSRITTSFDGIKYATAVFEGGSINIKSPFMTLVGLISRLTGLHPLIFASTVMALIMIPLAYYCYYLLIKSVFNGEEAAGYISLYVICFVNIFGYQSDKMMPSMLLTGYFTGYALTLHVILPLLARYLIERSRKSDSGHAEIAESDENNDDYLEEWDMKKHPIVNARNLAIALGLVALMLIGFVYVLNNKINTLYDATAGLQNELSSSCKIYEYAPNGEVIAYLIKNSDGSIVVVGGGDSSNAGGLCDFIRGFSDSVKEWYVYGEDEENSGACRNCIDINGLSVDNVYVIERTDLGR